MKKADSEFVIVGKLGSTYGIQGWLKVFSYTAEIKDILQYHSWYLESEQGWQAIDVTAGREHGKVIVVKLTGYDTPEEARLLTGKHIAIKRTQLPVLTKNEYYWADLKGLTVINQHGETLGQIAYLIETGSNDVMVIKANDKEYGIPYLPGKVVTRIDLDKKIMQVDWELI